MKSRISQHITCHISKGWLTNSAQCMAEEVLWVRQWNRVCVCCCKPLIHELPDDLDDVDFTLGVYQAIGLCPFASSVCSATNPRPTQIIKNLVDLLPPTISDGAWPAETMERNARKYAQRQVKWIRNKLLPTIKACTMPCRQRPGKRPGFS